MKKKAQHEIKRQAALTASGLIESALSEGTVVENLIEHGMTAEDAERVEQELARLAQRLSANRIRS